MSRRASCACWILVASLCPVPASAAEPSVVLPAFRLVDSAGDTIAPVIGATIDPTLGAMLLVRFVDPESRPLLLQAGPAGLAIGDAAGTFDFLLPPVPFLQAEDLEILFSNGDCTGATFIEVGVLPSQNFFRGIDVIYSSGRCQSDGTKICIYSAPLLAGVVSANVASSSVGNNSCTAGSPGFRDALTATEIIKIDNPFPWHIE